MQTVLDQVFFWQNLSCLSQERFYKKYLTQKEIATSQEIITDIVLDINQQEATGQSQIELINDFLSNPDYQEEAFQNRAKLYLENAWLSVLNKCMNIQAYEEGSITDEKPTKKNALCTGNVPLMWGVVGLSHSLNVNYAANIEYLEPNKPYFRLKFDATDDYSDQSTSPAINIYISPSQWQTLFEMCDQATLEARCDEIVEQAEAF